MVHILVYREESYHLAHCLEFDLLAQGDTPDEAFRNLLDAIELQVEFTRDHNDLSNLVRPAPIEYWRLLTTAEQFTPQANGWTLPATIAAVDCALVV